MAETTTDKPFPDKTCPACKSPVPVTNEDNIRGVARCRVCGRKIWLQTADTFYHFQGCDCGSC